MPDFKLSGNLEKSVKELAAKYRKLREDIETEIRSKGNNQSNPKLRYLNTLLEQSQVSGKKSSRESLKKDATYIYSSASVLQKLRGQQYSDARTLTDRLMALDEEYREILEQESKTVNEIDQKIETLNESKRPILIVRNKESNAENVISDARTKLERIEIEIKKEENNLAKAKKILNEIKDEININIFPIEKSTDQKIQIEKAPVLKVTDTEYESAKKHYDNEIAEIEKNIKSLAPGADKKDLIDELNKMEAFIDGIRSNPSDEMLKKDENYCALFYSLHTEGYIEEKKIQIRQIKSTLKTKNELCADYLKSHPALLAALINMDLGSLQRKKIKSVEIPNHNTDSATITIKFEEGDPITKPTVPFIKTPLKAYGTLSALIETTSERQKFYESSNAKNLESFILSAFEDIHPIPKGYSSSDNPEHTLKINFQEGSVTRTVIDDEGNEKHETFSIASFEDKLRNPEKTSNKLTAS
jgi:hypothetical protein